MRLFKMANFRTQSPLFPLWWLYVSIFLTPPALPPFASAADTLVEDIRLLAQQGDGESQFSLGLMYDSGDRVQRDPQRAFYWLTRAADSGITGARLYLGMKYQYGVGVQPDTNKAIRCYEEAAVRGWAQAAFLLGELYLSLEPRRLQEGCYWLKIAAGQDYPGADQTYRRMCSRPAPP